MLTHATLLISKMDPVKYIVEKPALTGRVAQWNMALTEYDIRHATQKSIKGSVLSNYLAHQPFEGCVSSVQTILKSMRPIYSALKLRLILGSKLLKSMKIQPWLLAKSKEIRTLEIISSSLTRSMS